MGLRKYKRSIAKARLRSMNANVSKLGSGIMPQSNLLRKKQKTRTGRIYLQLQREKKQAVWIRVLYGDLAKEAFRKQMIEGQMIKKRKLIKMAKSRRRIRKIESPAT